MPESTDNYRKAVADRLREEANAPLGLPTLFKCLHHDEDLPTTQDGYSLVYKCGKCVELLHDSWKKLRDDLDECVSKGGSRGIGKEAAAKFADRAAKLAEVE